MERVYQFIKSIWSRYPHVCGTCGTGETTVLSSADAMKVSSIGTSPPNTPPRGFSEFKFFKCVNDHLTRMQVPFSIVRWACMPHWTADLEEDD